MGIIRLEQKSRRVKVGEFEIANEIVFEYFDKQSEENRDELIRRAD